MAEVTEEELYRRKRKLLERALRAADKMDKKDVDMEVTGSSYQEHPDQRSESQDSIPDDLCPCCLATVDSGDYESGCCFRCGWHEGMPIIPKELPEGFDDDLKEWLERAYPKDESM